MKFFAFALFALLAPNTISAKSDDVEGEISIEIDSKCDLHCEWTAKDRRRLRGDVTAIEFIQTAAKNDVVVGSGTVELELLKVDIFGTSKSSDDVLVYDDSGISVTCPVFD
eukprot:CAMPEP_0178852764 /NCGR_PEP_ID=MMETSP0746-20121128/21854_1 /TAXON_ID=913974 /ORGANISM="Nitzschia punctata, Strain CCMP561" /LENGTH=110 /DNA_ID=CAMNT_0020518467 /DNA_START=949 /DNA_END=1282 /DNA_ORIENTATION=+